MLLKLVNKPPSSFNPNKGSTFFSKICSKFTFTAESDFLLDNFTAVAAGAGAWASTSFSFFSAGAEDMDFYVTNIKIASSLIV